MKGMIPRQFIDDLVARANIVDVVNSRIKLKKAGRDFQACCPFHNEKTPSFSVSPSRQIFKCFGCGKGGNVLTFLMEFDHLEFPEAVEELAGMMGLEVPHENVSRNDDRPQVSFKTRRNLYELLEAVAKFYQDCLAKSEEGQRYAEQRGLSPEIMARFDIGFAPDAFDSVLRQFGTNREEIQKLLDTRVLSQNERGNVYDFFRNRLIFPIRDKRGRVIAFGGRTIANDNRKYMNSGESPTYHKGSELYGLWQALQINSEPEYLFVVEGYMDVVSLAQYGINNVVAALGTAVTSEQVQAMFRVTDKIICSFDTDNAGRNAAWRTLELALPHLDDGRQIKFIFLPEGKDPDEFVRKQGKAAFEAEIEKALPLSDYLIDQLLKKVDLSSKEGQIKLGKLALPLIKQIPGMMLKEHLLNVLGQKLGILDPARLEKMLRETKTAETNRAETAQAESQPNNGIKRTPMRLLIALLLQKPELVKFVPDLSPLASLNEAGFDLFCEISEVCRQKVGISTGALLEHWRDTAHYSILEKLANWDHLVSPENMEKEFLEILDYLYAKLVEQQIEQLIAKERTVGLDENEQQTLALLISQR